MSRNSASISQTQNTSVKKDQTASLALKTFQTEEFLFYKPQRVDTGTVSVRYRCKNLPTLRLDLNKIRTDTQKSAQSNRTGMKSVSHAQRQDANLSLIEKDLSNFSTQKFNVQNYTRQHTNLKMMAFKNNIDQLEIQKLRLQNQTLKKKVIKIKSDFEDTQSKLQETQRSLSSAEEEKRNHGKRQASQAEDKAIQVPLYFAQ